MKLTAYQLRILRELRDGESVAELSRRLHGWANGATYKAVRHLHKERLLIRRDGILHVYQLTDAGRAAISDAELDAERIESLPGQLELFTETE